MKAGEHIEAFGHKWTVLNPEYCKRDDKTFALLLADDIWADMPMFEDGCIDEQR